MREIREEIAERLFHAQKLMPRGGYEGVNMFEQLSDLEKSRLRSLAAIAMVSTDDWTRGITEDRILGNVNSFIQATKDDGSVDRDLVFEIGRKTLNEQDFLMERAFREVAQA